MAEILNSGRNKIALQQGNSQPLNVAKFVFANIPGLVPTDPVNLAQGMPAAGNIVHQKAKTAQGYVASDQVVYSVILTPDEGNFEFNWVGLVDADNVLIAVSYTPLQNKYKTVGLNVGNTLTRNFLVKFNNAQAITGINVAAQTWQIDFTGWLSSVDETIRADMRDVFGDSRFLGAGMQVAVNAGVVSAKAGVGYVGGYRAVLAADTVVNAGALPKDIYIDCMLDGGLSGSNVIATLRASAPGIPLADFIDGNNKKHYVVKIASISVTSVVTDLRKTLPNNSALIDYLIDQLVQKAPISSPVFTDIPTAPTAVPGTNTKQLSTTEFVQAALGLLAVVARTGSAADLTGILSAARLPFSYGAAATPGHVVQRDASAHIVVPTAAPGDNSSKAASTAYVVAAVAAIIGSAPGALDTLNELAAALDNNPNFATTITNALAAKAPINSPVFTGAPTAPTPAPGANNTQLSTTEFVQTALGLLATVARTGNAANLIGTLSAAQLPFSYGPSIVGSYVAQRDANGHLYVPDSPLNESSAKAANTNWVNSFVTAAINNAINALVASAPGALNTLNELAAALGNDANFATNVTNALAGKAPVNSPALFGAPTAPTPSTGSNTKQIANAEFVQNLVATSSLKWSGSAASVSIGNYGAGRFAVKADFSFDYYVIDFLPNINTKIIANTEQNYYNGISMLRAFRFELNNGVLTSTFVEPDGLVARNITEVRKIGG